MEKIKTRFEENSDTALIRHYGQSFFIDCAPDEAATFQKAIADNKIPGVGLLNLARNAQDATFDLISPVKDSGPIDSIDESGWTPRTRQGNFGRA